VKEGSFAARESWRQSPVPSCFSFCLSTQWGRENGAIELRVVPLDELDYFWIQTYNSFAHVALQSVTLGGGGGALAVRVVQFRGRANGSVS